MVRGGFMSSLHAAVVNSILHRGVDPLHYGWWLASRAAGVVALLLVTTSTVLGLVMATKLLRKPGVKRALLQIHERAALTGLVAIGVHGVTLLGDGWLHPGLQGIALPFVLPYRTAFTGIGILAGWLAVILGLSFYARRRIGARRWRKLHRLTSLVWLMGVVHALGAGSDASTPWLRAILLGSTVPVGLLLILRLAGGRPRSRPRKRLPVEPVPSLGPVAVAGLEESLRGRITI
jgi:sulfoxide reductase heme-binding subunit YedZ